MGMYPWYAAGMSFIHSATADGCYIYMRMQKAASTCTQYHAMAPRKGMAIVQ